MAGAFDSFIRRNLHALYGTAKILLIPCVALSFVALFSPPESDSRVTALLATSVALHCVGFLVILQGPFFLIMRKSGFSAAIGVVLTLLFTAFVISMAAGAILAQKASSSSRALWCTWAMVVVDFVNIFVVGATLGRGSDVDEGVKEMAVPGNTAVFLTTHRGLLYQTMLFLLGLSFGLSIPSIINESYYQRRRSAILYVALGLQGIAFLISVAAPYYIPIRNKSITTGILCMLFFTIVSFVLHIAAGIEYFYDTPISEWDDSPVAFDMNINSRSFWFGWGAAITDAINFFVFFAILRGFAIDKDLEDGDISQSNVRKRRYKALPHVISQTLLAVSTGLSGAAMVYRDTLTIDIRAAALSVHCMTLLLTFHLPYRFMLRLTNLLVVSAFLFTFVLAAFGLLIAAGVTSVRRMDQNTYNGARDIWCNWAAVAIDFINLIIMTIPLIRGCKRSEDPGDMEMV